MTARLPHGSLANMVIVLVEIPALFENSSPFNWRESRHKHPQRLAARVHFDRGNPGPMPGRLPGPVVKESIHVPGRSSHSNPHASSSERRGTYDQSSIPRTTWYFIRTRAIREHVMSAGSSRLLLGIRRSDRT